MTLNRPPPDGNPIRCRPSGALPFLWLGTLVLFTLLFPVFQWTAWMQEVADSGVLIALLFTLGLLGVLAWLWFVALYWLAYEISLGQDGLLEFRSLARTRQMRAEDLVLIRPLRMDPAQTTLLFRTHSRTIRTLRRLDGLGQLIAALQAVNPRLEVRGLA